MKNRIFTIGTIIMFVGLCLLAGTVKAYYYYGDEEICFIEPSYRSFVQANPDIAFDDLGVLHMVWHDERETNDHIYHRMYREDGFLQNEGRRADYNTDCLVGNCYLNDPKIMYRDGSGSNFMNLLFSSQASPDHLLMSELQLTPDNWIDIGSITSNINLPTITSDYAVTGYGDTIFIAYVKNEEVHVTSYNGAWTSTPFSFVPGSGSYYRNVDIATDDAGYVYLAFDNEDMNLMQKKVNITRSLNVADISNFALMREVYSPQDYSFPDNQPRLDVRGKYDLSTLMVTVLIRVQDDLVSITEQNADWVNLTDPMYIGGTSLSLITSSYMGRYDVAIDMIGYIHAVWADFGGTYNQIYAAQSRDSGSTFSSLQEITDGTSNATEPVIAVSEYNDIAIAYERMDVASTVYARVVLGGFYDSCDDPSFPNWESHTGVEVSYEQSHDEGGASYKFQTSNLRGQLLEDLGSQNAEGTIEFWFYENDPPWTLSGDGDFWVEIDGDDGTKSGVYQMLGVKNGTSDTYYSYNTSDTSDWVATTRQRSAGWHQVIITVDETGSTAYLDPAVDPNPVFTSSMITFNQVQLQGGSDATPYYVDDIRIVTDIVDTPLDVPSLTGTGAVMLLGILGFMLMRWRRRR